MTDGKALIIAFALFTYTAAFGQTATSTLSGTMRDEAGGAIPGAAITVKNIATGALRTIKTDGEGRYFMLNLDPGEYELRAEAPGYKTAFRNRLILAVGGTTTLDLTLSVGTISDAVYVEAGGALIETSKVEISRVIATKEIETLPN